MSYCIPGSDPLRFSFQRLLEQQKGCGLTVLADFDEPSRCHPPADVLRVASFEDRWILSNPDFL